LTKHVSRCAHEKTFWGFWTKVEIFGQEMGIFVKKLISTKNRSLVMKLTNKKKKSITQNRKFFCWLKFSKNLNFYILGQLLSTKLSIFVQNFAKPSVDSWQMKKNICPKNRNFVPKNFLSKSTCRKKKV